MPRTKEQNAEYCKRFYLKNRERQLAKMRECGKKYYAENREVLIEKNRMHRAKEKIENPDQQIARSRRADAKKLKKLEWMLERQASRPRPTECEVCRGISPVKPGNRGIVWDHDHNTGKFRGWLCNRCNVVLGFVKDNPDILDMLAIYLREGGTTGPNPEEVKSALKEISLNVTK